MLLKGVKTELWYFHWMDSCLLSPFDRSFHRALSCVFPLTFSLSISPSNPCTFRKAAQSRSQSRSFIYNLFITTLFAHN